MQNNLIFYNYHKSEIEKIINQYSKYPLSEKPEEVRIFHSGTDL